jgi:hypothetical protein
MPVLSIAGAPFLVFADLTFAFAPLCSQVSYFAANFSGPAW